MVLADTTVGMTYLVVFGFVLGAAIASFLCVVFERVPRGESINGRSHCVCGRQLKALENVPILSWVTLRGKAPCCGASIPAFYVLAELYLGAAWGAAAALLSVGVTPSVLLVLVSTAAFVLYGTRRGRSLQH